MTSELIISIIKKSTQKPCCVVMNFGLKFGNPYIHP
jgi:hypothetical protein